MSIQEAPSLTPNTPVLGGAPSIEAPTKVETPPEADPFGPKFAALSKKEREIWQREQALKTQQEKYAKYESLEKLRSENPYQYSKEVGLDLDALISGATKDGQPPTTEDKLSALEKKIADYEARMEKEAADSKAAAQQKQLDDFRKSIHDEIKVDPDKYELIHLEEAFDTVYDVIAERHAKDGHILTTAEAADMVEKWLETKAIKYSQAKKLGFTKAEPKVEGHPLDTLKPVDPIADTSEAPTLTSTQTARTSEPAPLNETRGEAIARIAAMYNKK